MTTNEQLADALHSLTQAVEALTTKISELMDGIDNLGGYLYQNADETNTLAQVNEGLLNAQKE